MLRALKVIGLGTLIWLFTFLTIIVWTMGYAIYKTMSVASPDRANVDIRTCLGGPAIALACAADRRKKASGWSARRPLFSIKKWLRGSDLN